MELVKETMQLQGELKHAIAEMETIIGPEDRKILEIIKQHEKEEEAFVKEELDIKEKLEVQEKELSVKEEQEKEFYEEFKELFNQRSKLSDEVSNSESTIAVQNNKEIIFSITDNGIGIPKKDQKHIFNRYYRAENVKSTQGTGIGLNIVKNHLDYLGGSISFKSEENVGSTFTVSIPNINQK